MKRSMRLRPIADLAAHHEKEASQRLGATRRKLAKQERLLDELEDYHAEYTTENLMSHVASADPVRLQDYRVFLDRLERAIASQHQFIARIREELEQDHSKWVDRRSHRRALDNATDRYRRAEARDYELREQRQIEEVSALLRSRRPATTLK